MRTKNPTSAFQASLARAVIEDQTRSHILSKGRVPGAQRLSKLLSEHDQACPHPSAASAVAMCLSKIDAEGKISRLHSLDDYSVLTMIRRGGEPLLEDFSTQSIARMERSTRRDLAAAGMCIDHPGHFVVDFEFKLQPVRVVMHIHALVHSSDTIGLNQLRAMPWYQARPDCRRPILMSPRNPNRPSSDFLDYMIKSNWAVRSPMTTWRPEGGPRRNYHRLPSPHFDCFLVEMDRIRPGSLLFRVGGGKGRH